MIAKVKVMIIKRKLESQETKTAIMERFMYAHVAKVMTSKEKLIFF